MQGGVDVFSKAMKPMAHHPLSKHPPVTLPSSSHSCYDTHTHMSAHAAVGMITLHPVVLALFAYAGPAVSLIVSTIGYVTVAATMCHTLHVERSFEAVPLMYVCRRRCGVNCSSLVD